MAKTNLTLDNIKKESRLLMFMMNHEDLTSTPFKLSRDGCHFISLKGTKDYRSLQSMLQSLKRKDLAVNGSHGNWTLTPAGLVEAEYWLSKCGCRRLKEISAAKSAENLEKKESLEEKLAMVEAERDGLRVEITMANHTNEYLDEQNNLLREENSKLKKKIELIQQLLA